MPHQRPPSIGAYPSYLANQVAKAATRVLAERLAPLGVRPHHFGVLAALEDFGPQCQQDLCERLDVDKSHMVGFVDDLEEKGLAERQRDTEDRRRHRIAITEAGRALLPRLHAVELEVQDVVFAGLDRAQRDQLVELLGQVVVRADAQRLAVAQGVNA